MRLNQKQHEQIVQQLQESGETQFAEDYEDWIYKASHFKGTPLEEAELERRESFLILFAKERGIRPR